MPSCRPGLPRPAFRSRLQGLGEDVVDQGTLARARHAGDADERPQGDFHVEVLEVVVSRSADDEAMAVAAAAGGGDGDPPRAGKVLPGDALRLGDDRRGGSGGHDPPPANARPGAEIDDVVGRPHRVLVVLDHDHGVPLVAEPKERIEQLLVVALVQSDRRLVEDVEDADQAAADLSGEADALHFAAGKRRARSGPA